MLRLAQTSTIRDVQVKYDEVYAQYSEEHFMKDNEEVCRLRRSCMKNNQQGFIALISVLILSVVLLGAVISLAQYGMISRYALLTLEQKEVSHARARACIQVARIAITNDAFYETTNKKVSVAGSWCIIVLVDAMGSESVVQVSASSSGAVTNLEAVIDTTSGAVTKVIEVVTF